MAFQRSEVKLEGKVGDLSFYKVDEKYYAKQSSGHSKDRIANDPCFERTRENASEFGQASTFAKNLRSSLKKGLGALFELFDDTTTQANRLVKRSSNIIKADSINLRGQRKVLHQNTTLLTGLSLNKTAFKDAFFGNFDISWLQEEKLVRIDFENLRPVAMMDYPKNASVFQFHLCCITLDEQSENFPCFSTQSALLPITHSPFHLQLELNLDSDEIKSLIVFLGISFYKEIAGYPTPITSPNQNALDVIRVFNF